MNKPLVLRTARTVCPHDCPSTCALDVEVLDNGTIGRVRGAKDDPYTAGIICEKVARYAERAHHPDRLLYPLRRTGSKGSGQFERISWDEALDEIGRRFLDIEAAFGPEAIWPYYYAGTMGHVHRDGIDRLRHAKAYSGQYDTICTMISWTGYIAGTGLLTGTNPEQMAESDCVVIWGTNPVNTQINVMTHAIRARRERGAKIVVVDIYRTATMEQADLQLLIRPGSDGALALAVMHVLLRDGLADRAYLAQHTDLNLRTEAHIQNSTPIWAHMRTGLSVAQIEEFAHLVGKNPRSYFRLGYGFSRQRNGATNMHAALCIPAMIGAWQYRGGGAFHSNSGTWALDKSEITGASLATPGVREIDMCRIGAVLTGDPEALKTDTPVKALLIQNTNPMVVTPDHNLTRQGFEREDLFTVVHEQFMTETAEMADIVLPATMFTEHNDYYTRGGHTRVLYGPKILEAPGEAKPNHFVINEIAKRVDAPSAVSLKTDRELVASVFERSHYGDLDEIEKTGFVDRALPDEKSRYINGFAWADGKFRFHPDWEATRIKRGVQWVCDPADMPDVVSYCDWNEPTSDDVPFRLTTSPARTFLNSTFIETPGSQKREGTPSLLMHPEDALRQGLENGDAVTIGNHRGEVELTLRIFDGLQTGVVVAEGLHPHKAHRKGRGINVLIGSDPVKPFGGAAFHDAAVWVRASQI
ncbi:molybdopterin-containing oxidoreductase family protein [Pelagibacterium luteolum]|uniref:Anaerobic selenocysteine-containing dehydrogenase n=1 Tax=Pelagibacterium luteolum TaxID=440168 RepID=A0A1G7VUN0_9HYPH|nr:molybdopterin oxidoreductase family protein [Pelagibacterium luteolum]SDG63483.1 Anaerobic selenocysteine-containing dehydrogenase [Pelagibacterium luteolum]